MNDQAYGNLIGFLDWMAPHNHNLPEEDIHTKAQQWLGFRRAISQGIADEGAFVAGHLQGYREAQECYQHEECEAKEQVNG